jgi:hypothetical protein
MEELSVNPEGIESFSLGLARFREGLPWVNGKKNRNPERVESNPRFRHFDAMPQSLAKILIHTVFSTKDRRPFLRDRA